MTVGQSMLPEFDMEMASTRRLLERVPGEKGEWKPHPKSFPLGHLAQLVSWMPGWIARTINEPVLDLMKAGSYSFEPTEKLLEELDRNVQSARAALSGAKDSTWGETWKLTMGERELWSAPKGVVVRNHLNHLIHHRAQLTVYLRLLDVPVPGLYGPSADDKGFMG